jgi:hypothetical protein
LRTNHVHSLKGEPKQERQRSKKLGSDTALSLDGRVTERSNSTKERDQVKNDLEAEWVDAKLYLNNGLQNRPLIADDTLEK